MSVKDLDVIRQEIDQVDQELVVLLEKRMTLVNQVAAYKKATGKAILDTSREDAVLKKVTGQENFTGINPIDPFCGDFVATL